MSVFPDKKPMKKIVTTLALILSFGTYAIYQSSNGGSTVAYVAPANTTTPVVTKNPNTTTVAIASAPPPSGETEEAGETHHRRKTTTQVAVSTPTPVSKPTPVYIPTPVPVIVPKATGQYVDGTYTGSAADAYYGTVQVQVTVSGGKMTDVTFLQHPGGRSTSVYINSQAMPILSSEAIAAQSAQVDGVSGASDTSAAFQQSLASALSQAKA